MSKLAVDRSRKDALLLLTNDEGKNVRAMVDEAPRQPGGARPTASFSSAICAAIPMEKRPNPLAGKDAFIEMEPLTPHGKRPFSLRGRPAVPRGSGRRRADARPAAAASARASTRPSSSATRAAGCRCWRRFSRTTAQEFANAGYDVPSFFGREGGRRTTVRTPAARADDLPVGRASQHAGEPLRGACAGPSRCGPRSSSCRAAWPSSRARPSRSWSAAPSASSAARRGPTPAPAALSLAFFDALLYEEQSMGGRAAAGEELLLAFSLLKEKRLGNHRSGRRQHSQRRGRFRSGAIRPSICRCRPARRTRSPVYAIG